MGYYQEPQARYEEDTGGPGCGLSPAGPGCCSSSPRSVPPSSSPSQEDLQPGQQRRRQHRQQYRPYQDGRCSWRSTWVWCRHATQPKWKIKEFFWQKKKKKKKKGFFWKKKKKKKKK